MSPATALLIGIAIITFGGAGLAGLALWLYHRNARETT